MYSYLLIFFHHFIFLLSFGFQHRQHSTSIHSIHELTTGILTRPTQGVLKKGETPIYIDIHIMYN